MLIQNQKSVSLGVGTGVFSGKTVTVMMTAVEVMKVAGGVEVTVTGIVMHPEEGTGIVMHPEEGTGIAMHPEEGSEKTEVAGDVEVIAVTTGVGMTGEGEEEALEMRREGTTIAAVVVGGEVVEGKMMMTEEVGGAAAVIEMNHEVGEEMMVGAEEEIEIGMYMLLCVSGCIRVCLWSNCGCTLVFPWVDVNRPCKLCVFCAYYTSHQRRVL